MIGPIPKGLKWLDLPPLWLFAALGTAAVQARLWPGPQDVTFPVLTTIGATLFWIGIALIIGAVVQMALIGTTPIPHQEADKLVTSGFFRVSRNPIYLGDLMVLTGCCLQWGAWVSLALVPLLAMILTRRFIVDEEARLRAAFGPAFIAYTKATRRWI